ncbi:MAG: hypothetical protein RRY22_00295 [Bacilli bacterium]
MFEFIAKYWLEVIFGLFLSFIAFVFKRLLTYKDNIENINDGMKSILRIKISENYEKIIEKNCITLYDKEGVMDMYECYKKLGGNGFIDELIENINKIPIKENCK